MKKILNIYIIGLAIIILGGSCEDIYYPKKINSTEKIPVIQGIILEGKVPVVTLSWALGYYDKLWQNISGAQVYVKDNLGDSIFLEETSSGDYTSLSDAFKGIQGRSYSLHVKLPDGNVYASNSEFLEKKPVIDSLYASPETRTVFTYDANNKFFPLDQSGLSILADLAGNTDSTLYYRFNTKIVKQMQYTVDVSTPAEHSMFLWASSILDNSYSVNFTVTHNNRQVLREHHVGFLNYYYDATNETQTTTGTFIVGWVLTFNVYSVSRDVYNYYNSIAQLLNAKDEIFGPVPAQLSTNIRCINDAHKIVLGVFEAASITKIYKAFGWKSLHDYNAEDLSTFPDDIYNGITSSFPPYWWVLF